MKNNEKLPEDNKSKANNETDKAIIDNTENEKEESTSKNRGLNFFIGLLALATIAFGIYYFVNLYQNASLEDTNDYLLVQNDEENSTRESNGDIDRQIKNVLDRIIIQESQFETEALIQANLKVSDTKSNLENAKEEFEVDMSNYVAKERLEEAQQKYNKALKELEETQKYWKIDQDELTVVKDELNDYKVRLTKSEDTVDELSKKIQPELEKESIFESYAIYSGKSKINPLDYAFKTSSPVFHIKNWRKQETIKVIYILEGYASLFIDLPTTEEGVLINDIDKTITLTINQPTIGRISFNMREYEKYDLETQLLTIWRGGTSDATDEDLQTALLNAEEKAQVDIKNNVEMLENAQKIVAMDLIGLIGPIAAKSGYSVIIEYDQINPDSIVFSGGKSKN